MSHVQVHLEGDRFEPGSLLEGRVDWDAGGERPERMMISLLWHTAGKGTEDVTVVDQVEVVGPSRLGSRRFEFSLPAFPWSFSGTLISLIWSVEASLEPKGALSRADLVLAPGAEEILL